MRVRAWKRPFFLWLAPKRRSRKTFFVVGARAKKADFLAPGPAIQKMLSWEVLKNAQKRAFGGLEANYNQDTIFWPKEGAVAILLTETRYSPITSKLG